MHESGDSRTAKSGCATKARDKCAHPIATRANKFEATETANPETQQEEM
jgi:hypothetical protein